jgi:alpha-galactosidase
MSITVEKSYHLFEKYLWRENAKTKIDTKLTTITLHSPGSTYSMAVTNDGLLLHLYYGKNVSGDLSYMLFDDGPVIMYPDTREKVNFMSGTAFEFPCHGTGDYRETCLAVRDCNNASAAELKFVDVKTFRGKPALDGLPATFALRTMGQDDEAEEEYDCETAVITLEDSFCGLRAELFYTVFDNLDVITRSVKLTNFSDKDIDITRILSLCVDFNHADFEMITLPGSWGRERIPERAALRHGFTSVGSVSGVSSHGANPFIALVSPNTDEQVGQVFGFNFVYSGNFLAGAQVTEQFTTRIVMGINPFDFEWKLEPGETFTAPEVVMVYSDRGLGQMSRTFHDLYRTHLIPQRNLPDNPVLINNWEATYFNFDTDKLIAIAKEASKNGIDMLVVDDGWFGRRNSDNCSLGDWVVNEQRFPWGFSRLSRELGDLGMKLGLWFEPEMVSKDSDLYREHPDWVLHIEGRDLTESRAQYVLDFCNPAVRNRIFYAMKAVIRSAKINYIKWDMNRRLTEVSSPYLPKDRQRETFHRYMLGVYELMGRITNAYPDLLIENCSSGGGRYDPGMLYFSPQIWCSDDTDACERVKIQYGTSLCYPTSTVGSHVSDCPNHVTGRTVPFETRAHVAMAGTFGYELDITKIPAKDREQIPEQVARYKKYAHIMRDGDLYRLAEGVPDSFDAFMYVSKDKTEALFTFVQLAARVNLPARRIRLFGLDEDIEYVTEDKKVYSGSSLVNAGIAVSVKGDVGSLQIYLTKNKPKKLPYTPLFPVLTH